MRPRMRRHRGLAGARRAGEDVVPGRGLAAQPLPAAHLGHPQLRGDRADLLLDRVQADQPVEFGQRALHRGRVLVAAQSAGELGVALLQVARADGEQVLLGGVRRAGDHPHVAGLAGLLDQAADEPAVAQVVGDPAPADLLELAVEHRPRVPVEPLAAPLDRRLGQLHHLVRGVARELQPGREPGRQAGVGGQEGLHLLLVPGQDDDQVVAVVLGPLEQRLHGLLAEPVGLPVALVDQAVGLVDEQHPAQRGVDELVGLDGGGAEVLADQVGPVRLDDLRGLQQAKGVEDLGQHPGHGRLAGAGRAEEDEVPHGPLGADAGHRAPPRRLDGGGDRADLLLDRGQADHRVELGHRVLDRDRGPRPGGTALVVAGGVLGVGQRRGLRPDTGGRGSRMAAGLTRRTRRRVSRGPFPAAPAVHAGVLDALGHPPAEDGRGQQPRGDRADERLARCRFKGDDAGRHRPGQHPGDRAAGDETAGQRLGVGSQHDRERQQDHRIEPGPVVLVGEGEDRQAPERDRDRGTDGTPSLGHRDDAVDQCGQQDEFGEGNGGDRDDDLDPERILPVRMQQPGPPARFVRRRGLGPIVWQHHASSPLCPCLPRAQISAPGCRTVVRPCIAHDPYSRQHTRRYCR